MLRVKITKANFATYATWLGYEVEPEFVFSKKRKFRADWKISRDCRSCLVEYEGINGRALHTGKSGHLTQAGYTKDCEKYNLAQLEGWTVLRYTHLNFKNVFKDIEMFFSN